MNRLLVGILGALLGAGALALSIRLDLMPQSIVAEAGHEDHDVTEEGHGHEQGHGHGHDEEGEEHEPGVVELSEEAARTAGIEVVQVQPTKRFVGLEFTGVVKADQRLLAHIGPRIPGRIAKVVADLGDDVQTGAVLCEIDSVQLGLAQADYLRLKALLEVATANYEREKKLFERGTSSQKEMLQARATLLSRRAELFAVREKLLLYGVDRERLEQLDWKHEEPISYVPLRAPFAGRIIARHATRGEVVGPERRLFTIADLSRVWVLLDVYARDLPRVHVNQEAEITGDGLAKTLTGRVTYLSDLVDEATRTVRARLEVDNPDLLLRPGMFVRARIMETKSESAEGKPLIVLPADAVQIVDKESVVFVEQGPRRYALRPVLLGQAHGDEIEIRQGISPQDRVVVKGAFWLKSELSRASLGGGHSH